MKILSLLGLLILSASIQSLANETTTGAMNFDLRRQVENAKLRYEVDNPYSKVVDNYGNGFEPLYGVRNFRVVLNGIYYRGGANNTYHRSDKRSNTNPLPDDGLKNLCEEGFQEAVYLYTTNYNTAAKLTSCTMANGQPNQLTYLQISAFDQVNEETHLRKIHDHIKGNVLGPIYEHCWNGWHASGYVAAIALKQFCGYSNEEADTYWVRNTDGNDKGMDSIRGKLKAFKALNQFSITAEEKSLICPR